jgi:hypothetical protein
MTALEIALDLLRRSINPVPVPRGKKGPTGAGWQNLTITAENIEQHFNGNALNVGAQMGPKSNGLTDVDLDCREALALARYFLPETNSKYGRPSKPESHWLYTCHDPDPKAWYKLTDEDNAVIVELRLGGGGKGSQSIWPGSLHDRGETYRWNVDGERNVVSCAALRAAITKIAAATIVVRHWPASNRHEASLIVGGFLARAGWDEDNIGDFMVAVQEVAGVTDPTHVEGGRQAAMSAVRHMTDGGQVYGLPMLIEFFGEKSARKIARLIGYRESVVRVVNDEGFETDGRGSPLKTQGNIRKAMELIGVEVKYDAFHCRAIIGGLEDHAAIDDPAMDKLWLTIDERHRLLPNRDFFRIVVEEAARRNAFHPVLDYLNDLQWDGTRRLDKWLVTYCGAADTEYVKAVGAITLIAAVRRVRQPGCKFDEMLILEGKQGSERSTLLAALVPEQSWFSDDLPLNADGKKVIEQTSGKWIIEACELSGMRKADIEHLKAMLSRQYDVARLSYGRQTTERARQFITIGTTNSEIYLPDITGNRRFWPVKARNVDVAGIRRDRDQLWAEAAAREAEGKSIRLDQRLWKAAADQQEERTVSDPWHELISETLGDLKGKLLGADLWRIVGVDEAHRTQSHNSRIGNVMKMLGFERSLRRFSGPPQRCYVRGDEAERERQIYVTQEFDDSWSASLDPPTVPDRPPPRFSSAS